MEIINQPQPVYGIIYKITNLQNFKCYIGQTICEFEKRPFNHIKAALRGEDSSNKEFYRSIRKHGKENFKVEILQECYSQFQLDESEKYYIQHLYNSWWYECGYNVTGGGASGKIAMKTIGFTGRRHTEESKAKMSKTLKSANRKTIHSEETRRKLSEANIGKKLTEEHKRKVSDGLRNRSDEAKRETALKQSLARKGRESNRKGIVMSEEQKIKISISLRSRILTPEQKLKLSISNKRSPESIQKREATRKRNKELKRLQQQELDSDLFSSIDPNNI